VYKIQCIKMHGETVKKNLRQSLNLVIRLLKVTVRVV